MIIITANVIFQQLHYRASFIAINSFQLHDKVNRNIKFLSSRIKTQFPVFVYYLIALNNLSNNNNNLCNITLIYFIIESNPIESCCTIRN